MMYPRAVMVATATLDFFPVQGAHKSFAEVSAFYERFGHADHIAFAESYNEHQYSLKIRNRRSASWTASTACPYATASSRSTRSLRPTSTSRRADKSPSTTLDAQPLLHFIAEYADQARLSPHKLSHSFTTLTLRTSPHGRSPRSMASLHRKHSNGSASAPTPSAPYTFDRYLLHHSTYLQCQCFVSTTMASFSTKGAILWFRLKATRPKGLAANRRAPS